MELELKKTHQTFNGLTQFWSHQSSTTKTPMAFSTYVPEGKVRGCLIWLSGLTCNEENFITKAGAQQHLSDSGLMVICPDTSPRGLDLPGEHLSYDFGSGAGFYVNATTNHYKDHYQMYSYISEELTTIVRDHFNTDNLGIMGHSMGGHGALVFGLRESDKFKSVSAFSPIVNPTQSPWGIKALSGYLGEDEELWKNFDATELMKAGRKHSKPILIDQGASDEFLYNQLMPEKFKEACHDEGQSLELHLREGFDHSYYFISTFIGNHIEHHKRHLL